MSEILIATQDESDRTHLKNILESEVDCEVIGCVETGVEVVEQYQEHHPSVIILDAALPECNGVKAIVAIENISDDDVGVVFCTRVQRQDTKSTIPGGPKWYLHKPFEKEEVQKVVLNAINSTVAQ